MITRMVMGCRVPGVMDFVGTDLCLETKELEMKPLWRSIRGAGYSFAILLSGIYTRACEITHLANVQYFPY